MIFAIPVLTGTVSRFNRHHEGSAAGVWSAIVMSAGVLMIVLTLRVRGRGRSATGRAVLDQIDGFETYLRTAEADHLQFEEGQDIFSRYLPWAMIFGVVERWTRVCAELSAAGRIPEQPGWYSGDWKSASPSWLVNFSSTVQSVSTVARSSSSGSSGGSAFSGGGSSGGGAGGVVVPGDPVTGVRLR